jgi:hypothetical protein
MKPQTVGSIIKSFKREPTGSDFFSLGADGVLRVYYSVYHPKSFEVIDAERLSPVQIKDFLDRLPFDQAKEDKFRGVDGRGVPDEHLLNPPEEIRPERPSEEMIKEHQRMVEERNRKLAKMDSKPVCRPGKRSNYNIDPI